MIELYYSMVNIVDFLAVSEPDATTAASLYNVLDTLLNISAKADGEKPEALLSAIADANNAGRATSWPELVQRFRALHDAGERE